MGLAIVSAPIDESVPPAGGPASAIAATDGELLMRFARHRDQVAFAQVVERHGRLVWVVCRQVLRHHQDVEDAFQATFLILAQRAGTIRASDSAAAWLFKVAQRTALAARRKRSRRREQELPAEPPVGEEALPMIHDREMLYVLMEELRTLPERYQTPLVLRYFEGQSRRAIAEQTDSTAAQIQGRLVRGRRLLRSRMVRRGVSLSLAAGAVSTATATANAAVTPALIADTATSCLTFTTSGTASGTSPAALELAKQGVHAMWYASIAKLSAAATGLLTAGIVWAAQQGGGDSPNATNAGPDRVELQVAATEADESREPAEITVATEGGEAPAYVMEEVATSQIQLRRLEREQEHWILKAEAYRLKAEAKKSALEVQLPPGAMTNFEASEARADALLLEAEAKLAEAKLLEIQAQLRDMREQQAHRGTPRTSLNQTMQPLTTTIQAGDQLELSIVRQLGAGEGTLEKYHTFPVDSEGKIHLIGFGFDFDEVPGIEVAGLVQQNARDAINDAIKRIDASQEIRRFEVRRPPFPARGLPTPAIVPAPHAPATTLPALSAPTLSVVSHEEFKKIVDQLQQRLSLLEKENAELTKQMELRDERDEISP